MRQSNRPVHSLRAIILACAVLALTGLQTAGAGEFHGAENNARQALIQNNDKRAEFLQETQALRREIMVKRAEMRALLRADNPDPDQAGILAGELFDLREQIREKALEAGLPPRFLMGRMTGCCLTGTQHP